MSRSRRVPEDSSVPMSPEREEEDHSTTGRARGVPPTSSGWSYGGVEKQMKR